MVCLDGKDDWIFVTEDTGKCDWSLKPMLFDELEDAITIAKTFTKDGNEENVRVIDYED